MSSRNFAPALILCMAAACALAAGCKSSEPRQQAAVPEAPASAEAPPPAAASATPEAAAKARELPPPDAAEVRGAVERVFKGAVTIGPARDSYFVVGDFNGDDSQDLAVAVSPAPGRLEEINDELASWIVKDPFEPPPGSAASYGAARERALIKEGDALLAVIHGFEAEGWRDERATQTYVLKDAAGAGLKARERKAALATGGKLPRLLGDVIDETVAGREGFLYYNGAHYTWFDPRGYRPPPPARLVHGGAVKAVQQ
ncbi:MAG TPA: hypothetical protein VF297_26050 [Pyrinomonadaceae bacterium]